jgi:hypothetical protein
MEFHRELNAQLLDSESLGARPETISNGYELAKVKLALFFFQQPNAHATGQPANPACN